MLLAEHFLQRHAWVHINTHQHRLGTASASSSECLRSPCMLHWLCSALRHQVIHEILARFYSCCAAGASLDNVNAAGTLSNALSSPRSLSKEQNSIEAGDSVVISPLSIPDWESCDMSSLTSFQISYDSCTFPIPNNLCSSALPGVKTLQPITSQQEIKYNTLMASAFQKTKDLKSLCMDERLVFRLPGSPAPGEELQSLDMSFPTIQVIFLHASLVLIMDDLKCMTLHTVSNRPETIWSGMFQRKFMQLNPMKTTNKLLKALLVHELKSSCLFHHQYCYSSWSSLLSSSGRSWSLRPLPFTL